MSMPSKKHVKNDVNLLDFSSLPSLPLKESTLIEEDRSHDEIQVVADMDFQEDISHKKCEDNYAKNKDTIEFLRKLLKTKDDVICHKETDKSFLQTRIDNLEALLAEKEAFILNLTTQIEDLGKQSSKLHSVKFKPVVVVKSTTSEPRVDTTTTEVNVEPIKRKTIDNKKCVYEDKGKCKLGYKCQNVHPKETCQAHGKLGACPASEICEMRHPLKLCFQWKDEGTCARGDSCRFRHPLELLKRRLF